MKKLIFSLFSVAVLGNVSNAQQKIEREHRIHNVVFAEANMETDNLNYLPTLTHLRNENESENPAIEEWQEELTREKLKNKINTPGTLSKKQTRGTTISLGKTWKGIVSSGTPPDCHMAVNTLGHVVAVINSTLRISNAQGVTLYTKSLPVFFNLGLVAGQPTGTINDQCDPRVLFDCESRRFIAFAQTCDGTAANSRILVAVSKEEDPIKGWFCYAFDSDPAKQVWFDYPHIGVNADDLFATGNMFTDGGNFTECFIFQIDKKAMYAGNSNVLGWIHDGLGAGPFSITPVNQGLCVPQMINKQHLVYSRLSGQTGTAINLLTITGKGTDATQPTITTTSITTAINYSTAAYAEQPGSSILLKTGDTRMQDAIMINGVIHCAFHCNGTGNFVNIHYSRLTNNGSAWSCTSKKLSLANTDIAYPSLAAWENSSYGGTDQSCLIGFLASSATEFPCMKAVVMDNSNVAGPVFTVKAGTQYVDYLADMNAQFPNTRWGDYSGLSRQHHRNVPVVWFNGMWGDNGNVANGEYRWSTQIGELTNGVAWPTSTTELEKKIDEASVYPNPANGNYCNININTTSTQDVNIWLTDATGKTLAKLMQATVISGTNEFRFNTSAFSNGIYFVHIEGSRGLLRREKLAIQNN